MPSNPCDEMQKPRPDKLKAEINNQNDQLSVSDDDRQKKYKKMGKSAFDFYRGTNNLYWMDFAGHKRLKDFGGVPETRTWLQGDLHVENFGAFGNDEGEVVYNVNDFDDAVKADYQYDLWRMVTSIVLAARDWRHKLSDKELVPALDAFGRSYLEQVLQYRDRGGEEGMVFRAGHTSSELDDFLQGLANRSSRQAMLNEWTVLSNGQRTFNLLGDNGEKLTAVDLALREKIAGDMKNYRKTLVHNHRFSDSYFKVLDLAKRLSSGTGSLGVPRYYVLVAGASSSPDSNCILDIKRQSKPTAYHFLNDKAEYEHYLANHPGKDAGWHMAAYRVMAKHTDDHLGWMKLPDGFYSVREISFFKETYPPEDEKKKGKKKGLEAKELEKLAELWGKVLATDHCRALSAYASEFPGPPPPGFDPDAGMTFKQTVVERTDSKYDDFQKLLREVAFCYADQVELDWKTFKDLVRKDLI